MFSDSEHKHSIGFPFLLWMYFMTCHIHWNWGTSGRPPQVTSCKKYNYLFFHYKRPNPFGGLCVPWLFPRLSLTPESSSFPFVLRTSSIRGLYRGLCRKVIRTGYIVETLPFLLHRLHRDPDSVLKTKSFFKGSTIHFIVDWTTSLVQLSNVLLSESTGPQGRLGSEG